MKRYQLLLLGMLLGVISNASWAQVCQDQVSAQPDARFVVLDENHLVRDRLTGLLWQRCSVGQFWNGKTCEESSKRMIKSWFSWEDKRSAIIRTEKSDGLGDWRVPTINELQTIVNYQCIKPAINDRIFPNTPSWKYWTTSLFSDNTNYAWVVDFTTGKASTALLTNASYHIRLVRGKLPRLNVPTTNGRGEHSELAPWNDGIHSLDNPDVTALQPWQSLSSNWSLDAFGQPDWAALLRNKKILPRASVYNTDEEMVVWDHDILYKETAEMPWVKFPHGTHSQWLSCENCHDGFFSQKAGESDISMGTIYSGEHCGQCHGRVAFNLHNCERCHSQIHDGVPDSYLNTLSNK